MRERRIRRRSRRNPMVGGLVLIALGLLALLGQYFDFAWSAPLALLAFAGLFIIAGIITRESGYFIPGGILAGIGVGIGSTQMEIEAFSGLDDGGVFLFLFSLGWALIPVLSMIFTKDRHLWALIPGTIIGLVGLALMWGGMALDALELLGTIWPVFLILLGVYILFRRQRPEEVVEKQPEEQLEYK